MPTDYWDPYNMRNPYSTISQVLEGQKRLAERCDKMVSDSAEFVEKMQAMKKPQPLVPDFRVSTTPTFQLQASTERVVSSGTPKKKKAPVLPRVLFWAVLFTLFGLAAFRLLMLML